MGVIRSTDCIAGVFPLFSRRQYVENSSLCTQHERTGGTDVVITVWDKSRRCSFESLNHITMTPVAYSPK